MPDEPWSTWTAPAYLLAGALGVAYAEGVAESWVFFGFTFLLMAGTGWMHWRWTPDTRDLDRSGMNATFAALAVWGVGGGPILMAVYGLLSAGSEWVLEFENRPLVLAYGSVPLAALIASGAYGDAFGAVACFAAGYTFWLLDTDLPHGIWHILTAAGMFTLFVGVV